MKAVALLFVLFAVSAAAQAQEPSMSEGARVCDLEFNPNATLIEKARLCAEAFIDRNGYTESPPSESSRYWAFESIEREASWDEIFATRRETLRATANGTDCSNERCLVLFRSREEQCAFRAVTMTLTLTEMQVVHQAVSSTNCDE